MSVVERATTERDATREAVKPPEQPMLPRFAGAGDTAALFAQLQQTAGNQAVGLLLRQQAQAASAAGQLPTTPALVALQARATRRAMAAPAAPAPVAPVAPPAEQAAPTAPIGPEGGPLPAALAERIEAKRGDGAPLDTGTRAAMEGPLGADLTGVRVHTDPEADALNQSVSAVAFTTGSDIFFRQGAYAPGSPGGDGLLAHELTHVVQQGGSSGGGPLVVGPADDPAEHAAEAASQAVVGGQAAPAVPDGSSPPVARRLRRVAAPPTASPGLHQVLDQIEGAARHARHHDPPHQLTHAAQHAAPIPANDTASRAHAVQAETMNAAPVARPQPQSFRDLLHTKLLAIAPTNNQQVKDFKKNNKAAEMHGALMGEVQTQRQTAQGPVATAANAPAPTVPAQTAGPAPAAPAASPVPPIQAAQAVPPPAPDPAPALAQGAREADQHMTDANVTPEQLSRANDPRFSAVNQAHDEVHAHAATAPAQFQAQQQQVLQTATAGAHGAVAAAHAGLQQAHAQAHAGAHGQQQEVMTREAHKRQEVADHVEGMFTETKTKVEAKLAELGPAVDKMFTDGEKAAREGFENEVDRRTIEHDLLHPLDAAWGALTGVDAALEQIFHEARDHYMAALDPVLDGIANRVELGLKEAKDLIAAGHKAIDGYVAGLEPSLRASGQQAEQAIGSRFAELQQSVDAKKEELANHLVERYQQAQQEIDKRVQELHDAHSGLLGGFLAKLQAVLEAIEQFKARLQAVVQDAGATLDLIIKDPIAFLGHLLSALAAGFNGFLARIGAHLEQGFIAWLTGGLGGVGVQLPAEWDLKGVISLVLQVLGITWDKITGKIRAKVEKMLGPRAMQVIDKVIAYAQAAWNGGVQGLIDKLKEDLGSLKEMLFGAIKSYLIETVVKVAIAKLVALSNPVGEIVEAVMDIYKVVMFFIEKANQIMTLVETIVRSVSRIAHGDIAGAAAWVEQAMANTIPIMIGFLADLLGLGDLPEKIAGFIKDVQGAVDHAIDVALEWLIEKGKDLFKSLFGKKDDDKADERTDEQKDDDIAKAYAKVEPLVHGQGKTPEDVKKALPAIRSEFKLTTLDMEEESASESKEKVTVVGTIQRTVSPVTAEMLKAGGRDIIEVTAFNGTKVQCVKEGSVLIPVGKVTIFPMGKVAMYPKDELEELQKKKQTDRKNYDKDPKNEERLEKIKDLRHNWERSQQMFEELSKVGFADSIETVNTIMSHLISTGEEITAEAGEATKARSDLQGPIGGLKVMSTWRVLPDGSKYLSTIQFIPKE